MVEQYFYLDSEQKQYGPCSLEELRTAGITRGTKVWRAGMTDWDDAGNVSDLQVLFEVPPVMQAQPPAPGAGQTYTASRNPQPMYKPDSWLAWSIVSLILCFFCCWLSIPLSVPFSIVGIVHASKVDNLWASGQHEEAYRNAKSARQWTIASAITGFMGLMIYLLLLLFGVFSSALPLLNNI